MEAGKRIAPPSSSDPSALPLKDLRLRARYLGVENRLAPIASLAFLAWVTGASALAAESTLDFNRQIRPILSDNCFKCHGFDEKARKSKLRLDTPEGATRPAKSGRAAIVPHDLEKSELIARITASDPDDLMPPKDSDKKLRPDQIELLRRWVSEGAKYAKHWSLELPVAAPLPKVKQSAWPRNEVDAFVLERMEAEGMKPSAEADKATLLRRVTLDLTGLPPSLEELNAFLADKGPNAYEHVVQRLLDSPHYGEHLAVDWLDAARYADTNGYFGDHPRQAWPWRDWVISAFNRDLPFDQFTIEQLAGDLLPNATRDQRVATGFNRNHMTNNESGIIDEEYRVEYVVDELEATSNTWLGLTMGCARCHDHKFDPISQKEFYQVFAFFNSVPETGMVKTDDPPPILSVPTPQQEQALKRCLEEKEKATAAFAALKAPLQKRIDSWAETCKSTLPQPPSNELVAHVDFEDRVVNDAPGSPAFPAKALGTTIEYVPGIMGQAAKFDATQHAEIEGANLLDLDRAWTIGLWLKADGPLACVFSKIQPINPRRGIEMIWQKGRLLINLEHEWGVKALEVTTVEPLKSKEWCHVVVSYDGSRKAEGLKVYGDGKALEIATRRESLEGTLNNEEPFRIGRRDSGLGFYGELDELRLLKRTVTPAEVEGWYWGDRLRGIMEAAASKHKRAADNLVLLDYFVDHWGTTEEQTTRHHELDVDAKEAALQQSIPSALVMAELPKPRQAAVLNRGLYDQRGEAVQPDVPASIAPWPAGAPRNRLGFAQWLVSPQNPLPARVAVNRLWRQCFGEGLVRTVNDFGTQGEAPTHPQLLDWLAVKFVRDGWKMKEMLRYIVCSATYRQSSAANAGQLQRDPENRLLARGPRFRLSAEMVRDQALAVSGLLSPKIGGPSVRPYQPPGLWEAVSYNGEESYQADRGDGLWRRSLYTYWKRQVPPPALQTFDGPTREKCVVSRARTNTPLQALVLLNDDTYVEAARALAARTLQHAPAGDGARITELFRRATQRQPEAEETAALQGLLDRQRQRLSQDSTAAEKLLAVGESPAGRELPRAELSAWTVVAQTVLNLDELITQR